jgi:hedgehog protein
MDSDGQLVYSEVLLFLDRSSDEERDFVVLKAEDGSQITLTASHLIYTVSAEDLQEDMDLNEEENWQSNSIDDEDRQMAKRLKELNVTVSNDLLRSRLKATFAYKAQIGDWIVVTDASGRAQPQRIVDVSVVHKRGVYAPLTSQGTLVVDNVVVSCYAVIDDQSLAHWAFAPIRILNNIQSSMVHFWKSFSGSVRWWRYHQGTTVSPLSFNPLKFSSKLIELFNLQVSPVRYEARSSTDVPAGSAPVGIHWYAKFLYRIAKYILPSHLVYN